MDLFNYILFWVCIVGLCLGSFFNVVILRSLSNESIVFPASKCPKCNHKLYFWHNIPVLSYILLRGKCYFCKEKISIQYPIVELSTMVLFGLTFLKFGISYYTLLILASVSCFIIMTVTDLKERVADCNIAIGLGILGILYNGLTWGWQGVLNSVLGLLVGALILEIIARLGYLFVKTRAMGEADTFVAGSLGAVFGMPAVLWILLYGFIASMVFIIPMFFYNQFKNNNRQTCILGILFTLSVLVFQKVWQNYYTMAILLITGILLAISVMKSARFEENRSYLPYIPALFAGMLIYLVIA